MSVVQNVILGRAVAKSGTSLLARIQNTSTGAYVTQASISAITYHVRDLTGAVTKGTGTLDPAAVIFDTLQLSPLWTQDSTGYNFKTVVMASFMSFTPTTDARGNPVTRRWQVDVKFAPVTGEPFVVVFQVDLVPAFIA